MNKNFLKPLLFGVFVFALCAAANAQNKKSTTERVVNTSFIIVGQSTKIAYQTAKFTGKEFVKPAATKVAKPLLLKVVPKVTVFLVKKGTPVVQKLFVTYLKTRLSL